MAHNSLALLHCFSFYLVFLRAAQEDSITTMCQILYQDNFERKIDWYLKWFDIWFFFTKSPSHHLEKGQIWDLLLIYIFLSVQSKTYKNIQINFHLMLMFKSMCITAPNTSTTYKKVWDSADYWSQMLYLVVKLGFSILDISSAKLLWNICHIFNLKQ